MQTQREDNWPGAEKDLSVATGCKDPSCWKTGECGLEDPAMAPLHKPKRTANVCKVCWELGVPYAMGHVQESNSVVMKWEDQGKISVFMGLGYQAKKHTGLG